MKHLAKQKQLAKFQVFLKITVFSTLEATVTYSLITFIRNYFVSSKLCLICVLQFFFMKWNVPIISSPLRSLLTYVHRTVVFNFLVTKKFFTPIWNVAFCKNVLIFRYPNMITDFKFMIFLIIFFIKVNICARLYINRLYFDCAMICIVVFINYISYFINIHNF